LDLDMLHDKSPLPHHQKMGSPTLPRLVLGSGYHFPLTTECLGLQLLCSTVLGLINKI
jgi:hypothetical protein